MPSTHPSRLRFLDRVNFFGQVATMDKQGRVLLPQILRETAAMVLNAPASWRPAKRGFCST